jgi:hypothetical protein
MGLRALFGFKAPRPERAAIERVKGFAKAALTDPDAAVSVNEIACNDPGCPGIETVILVMEPGRKTRALKVAKPLDEVAEQDILEALEA